MTCIVAFKTKLGTVVAGDLLGSNLYTKHLYSKSKVFSNSGYTMGYTYTFRFGQLMEYKLKPIYPSPNDTDLTAFLVNNFIPAVLKVMETNKHLDNPGTEASSGTAIVEVKNRIFVLQSDLAILEHDKFASVGCGKDMAEAIMLFHKPWNKVKTYEDIEKFLTKLFKTVSEISCGVSKEFTWRLSNES